jgi:hypothetical protein
LGIKQVMTTFSPGASLTQWPSRRSPHFLGRFSTKGIALVHFLFADQINSVGCCFRRFDTLQHQQVNFTIYQEKKKLNFVTK